VRLIYSICTSVFIIFVLLLGFLLEDGIIEFKVYMIISLSLIILFGIQTFYIIYKLMKKKRK